VKFSSALKDKLPGICFYVYRIFVLQHHFAVWTALKHYLGSQTSFGWTGLLQNSEFHWNNLDPLQNFPRKSNSHHHEPLLQVQVNRHSCNDRLLWSWCRRCDHSRTLMVPQMVQPGFSRLTVSRYHHPGDLQK